MKIEKFTESDMQKDPIEFFEKIKSDENIEIKSCPYEDKLRFLRYSMRFTSLANTSVLTNITFLVYGKNISDEVFEDERIMFSNLEEYVDARYDLKSEIEEYSKELLKFYLASVKSYGVILPDGKINIPASYKIILMSSGMKDISALMRKSKIDAENIPLVFNAEEIIQSFQIADSPMIKEFIDKVLGSL